MSADRLHDLRQDLASLRIERDPPSAPPRRWPWVLAGLLALAVAVHFAGRHLLASQPEVRTVTVLAQRGGGSAPGVLTASGYLVARRKAVVSAKIQGRLAELRVEEGSRVRQGDLLARLESNDAEAGVARAQAALQRAQADAQEAERQRALAERLEAEQVGSRDQRDAALSRARIAQAGVAQAQADLAYAQAALDNTRIVAPFTGTVVKKMAEVGESVAPIPPGVNISTSSGAIVALADLETLELEADVAESNVAKLAAEQPAEVTVEAFPDRTYRAVLRQVIPTADRTKATVQVKVTLAEKDARLRPEMSARVTFLEPARKEAAAGPPVVMAPVDAVVSRDGRAVVFELVEGRVRQRPVQVGPARQGQVEVREGLAGGEQLVLQPPEGLRDGQRVRSAEGR